MTMTTDAPLVRDITDEEVWQFHEQGWVRLPNFINPDVARSMQRETECLLGAKADKHRYRAGVDAVRFEEWWIDYSHVTKEGIEPFRSFSLSKQQGRNVRRLFARNVPGRLLIDMVGAKSGFSPAGDIQKTPYHQDYPTGPWDRSGHCSFWVALHDMPTECGLVRFFSGSHREGALGAHFHSSDGEHGDLLKAYPFISERYPPSELVPMRAGDATVHGPLVVHYSEPNTTDQIRWHYIAQYFASDARWTGQAFGDWIPGGNHGRLTEPGQLFDHPDWPIVEG
jgi:hypothetical protein